MSTAYIKELERLQDGASSPMQVWNEPGAVEQTPVTFSSHAESDAFAESTRFIVFTVDAICSYVVGESPAATTNSFRLPADALVVIGVRPGDKISFIDNT